MNCCPKQQCGSGHAHRKRVLKWFFSSGRLRWSVRSGKRLVCKLLANLLDLGRFAAGNQSTFPFPEQQKTLGTVMGSKVEGAPLVILLRVSIGVRFIRVGQFRCFTYLAHRITHSRNETRALISENDPYQSSKCFRLLTQSNESALVRVFHAQGFDCPRLTLTH